MKPREHLGGLPRTSPAGYVGWPPGCGPLAECVCVQAIKRDRWVWSPDSGGGDSRGRIRARCGRRPIVRAQAAPWAPGALSPADCTAQAPRGRAWRFPGGAGPVVHPRQPPTPGSRVCLGAAGGGETERGGGGRSDRGCVERGRRSARKGGRGRVCAPGRRAAGRRTRAQSAPPGLADSRGA